MLVATCICYSPALSVCSHKHYMNCVQRYSASPGLAIYHPSSKHHSSNNSDHTTHNIMVAVDDSANIDGFATIPPRFFPRIDEKKKKRKREQGQLSNQEKNGRILNISLF